MSDAQADRWQRDGETLRQIGHALGHQDTRVSVELPSTLGELALAAWERHDANRPTDGESVPERRTRHDAATLALIGLAIQSSGRWSQRSVHVELDAQLIGRALDLSDST